MTNILDLKPGDIIHHELASRVEEVTDHGMEVSMTWTDCNGYVESRDFPHDREFKVLPWSAAAWEEFRQL